MTRQHPAPPPCRLAPCLPLHHLTLLGRLLRSLPAEQGRRHQLDQVQAAEGGLLQPQAGQAVGPRDGQAQALRPPHRPQL